MIQYHLLQEKAVQVILLFRHNVKLTVRQQVGRHSTPQGSKRLGMMVGQHAAFWLLCGSTCTSE